MKHIIEFKLFNGEDPNTEDVLIAIDEDGEPILIYYHHGTWYEENNYTGTPDLESIKYIQVIN